MSKEEINESKKIFKEIEDKINDIHLKYGIDIKLEECLTSEHYTLYKIIATKKEKEVIIYD